MTEMDRYHLLKQCLILIALSEEGRSPEHISHSKVSAMLDLANAADPRYSRAVDRYRPGLHALVGACLASIAGSVVWLIVTVVFSLQTAGPPIMLPLNGDPAYPLAVSVLLPGAIAAIWVAVHERRLRQAWKFVEMWVAKKSWSSTF